MASRYQDSYGHMLELLKTARLEAELRQSDVASKIGVNQTWVSKVELGERRLDPVELVKLAQIYGKPVSEFLPEEVR